MGKIAEVNLKFRLDNFNAIRSDSNNWTYLKIEKIILHQRIQRGQIWTLKLESSIPALKIEAYNPLDRGDNHCGPYSVVYDVDFVKTPNPVCVMNVGKSFNRPNPLLPLFCSVVVSLVHIKGHQWTILLWTIKKGSFCTFLTFFFFFNMSYIFFSMK